jgi:hypothetical protein
MTSSTKIRILHLSDFHGAGKTKKTPDRWWEERIAKLAGEDGFDAVVCSGDIGFGGTEKSLKEGFDYLKLLVAKSSGTRGRSMQVVIAPGNHDVIRPSMDMLDTERDRVRFANFITAANDSTLQCVIPDFTEDRRVNCYTSLGNHVCIVPICTTWFSGDEPPEYREIASILSAVGVNEDTQKKVKNALATDMPFVRMADIDNLSTFASGDSPLNKAIIRIAVAHHPLWPLPSVESTYRGFDTTANGMEVATRLDALGFQLVLHGHKHYLGCSMIAGIRSRVGSEVAELTEILSASGGLLFDPDESHRFGFQTVNIEITDGTTTKLSINNVTRGSRAEGMEICKAIVSLRPIQRVAAQIPNYAARWMKVSRHSADEKKKMGSDWQLRYDVVSHLGMPDLVQAVDAKVQAAVAEQIRSGDENGATNLIETIVESDHFLSVAINSLKEFTSGGSRGVDDDFVKRITKSATTSKRAMVFVDVNGNGTWGRPDLIENAASLFRVYTERNHERFGSPDGPRAWRCRLSELETAVTNVLRSQGQSSSSALEFDLARILVWTREALYAPSALVLLHLHRVFKVPLFFVDLADICHSYLRDFHLEWSDTDTLPDRGEYQDKTTSERVESEPYMLQQDWIMVKQLLVSAKDPFDVMGNKLSWLLR